LTASGNFTSKGIDDNATSTAITIDANENVGIGSTTPKAALDIIDSSAARVYLGTSASNYGGLVYSNGVMSMRGIGNGSAAVVSADATNSEITFTTAGVADRMVIDAAGTTTVTGGFLAAQPGAGSNAFAAGSGSGATGQQRSCVAIGYQAGQTNQQDYAVAMGHLTASLGQGVRATALGILAGYDTQGAYAVSVGASTGSVRQGSYGVGVGHQAGKTDQGDHAIAIGRDVGFTNQGASSIAIGRGAGYSVQGANSIAIGENAGQTDQGANGIIISSRGVAENITGANHIMLTSGAGKYFYYNGTNQWTFSGGKVAINQSVAGVYFEAAYSAVTTVTQGFSGASGQWYVTNGSGGVTLDVAGTTWGSVSDETLKENISDVGPVLDTIKDFRCVNYSLKATESEAADKVGFIAQDWEHTFPNVVSETDEGTLSMKYTETIPVLLKAIQELTAKVEALENA
jgi:hypothetical protein